MTATQESFLRRFLRFTLYVGPLLAFASIFLWFGSGERGRYETTWRLIPQALAFLCPEFAPADVAGQTQASLYQLNGALRRLAHVVGYSILTAFIVRAIQRGEPRLKPLSFLVATLIGIAYCGLDEWKRALEPNRHAKWADLEWNLIGVAVTLGGTLLFFGIKEWERYLQKSTT